MESWEPRLITSTSVAVWIRAQTKPFVIWGIIAKLPVTEKLKPAGEIDSEAVQNKTPDNSALMG